MIRRYCTSTPLNILLPCLLLVLAERGWAQSSVTLTPSMDNTIYENDGNRSNGAGDFLFVGNTGSFGARRALLAFDLEAELPDGAQVESVELSVRLSKLPVQGGAAEIDVHRLTRSWGEGGSDAGATGGDGAPAQSGDATWTHAFFQTETWQSAGGDHAATSSATISFGTQLQRYTVESSGGLAADVQGWLDDPSTNFGWILVGDEFTLHTARRLDGGEHPTAGNRPQLTIHYSMPTAAENPDIPGSFVLEGNHPNPFHTSTTIRYELEAAGDVGLEVYDVTGRPVRSIPIRRQAAGPQHMDVPADGLATGLYVYCLTADGARRCATMTVLR